MDFVFIFIIYLPEDDFYGFIFNLCLLITYLIICIITYLLMTRVDGFGFIFIYYLPVDVLV